MGIDDYISMLNDFSNASWDLLHIENLLVLTNTKDHFIWI